MKQAARILAFQLLHDQWAGHDPRRKRLFQDWLIELARGPCSLGEPFFAMETLPEALGHDPEGGRSTSATYVVGCMVEGNLCLSLETTSLKGHQARVPGFRFDFKNIPQRFLRFAAVHQLKKNARYALRNEGKDDDWGPSGLRRGDGFFLDWLARDDDWLMESLPDFMTYLVSMDHGALWGTFRHHRAHLAHRWAWLTHWFSRTDFDFEVEQGIRGITDIQPFGSRRVKYSPEKAKERAIDLITSRAGGYLVEQWPGDPKATVRPTRHEVERALEIRRKAKEYAAQYERKVGPPHIKTSVLKKPAWATLQQHLCHHFVKTEGMTWQAAADLLGIGTAQEVGRGVATFEKNRRNHEAYEE